MQRLFPILLLCLPYLVFGFVNKTEILDVMNIARTTPATFAAKIEAKYMQFVRFKWIVGDEMWLTNDGINAVREAVSVLKSASAVSALKSSKGLDVMAQVHANYLKAQANLTDAYTGCSGNNVGTRVADIGKWTSIGESILGRLSTAEEIVVQLLVSDGDANRRHRTNLLNPSFDSVGFGFSNSESVSGIVVIDYAEGFKCTNTCPKIPTLNKAYNCIGAGYEYAGAGVYQLPIFVLVFITLVFLTL